VRGVKRNNEKGTPIRAAGACCRSLVASGEITGQNVFLDQGRPRYVDWPIIMSSFFRDAGGHQGYGRVGEGGHRGWNAQRMLSSRRLKKNTNDPAASISRRWAVSSIDFAALAKQDRTYSELAEVKTEAERIKREA